MTTAAFGVTLALVSAFVGAAAVSFVAVASVFAPLLGLADALLPVALSELCEALAAPVAAPVDAGVALEAGVVALPAGVPVAGLVAGVVAVEAPDGVVVPFAPVALPEAPLVVGVALVEVVLLLLVAAVEPLDPVELDVVDEVVGVAVVLAGCDPLVPVEPFVEAATVVLVVEEPVCVGASCAEVVVLPGLAAACATLAVAKRTISRPSTKAAAQLRRRAGSEESSPESAGRRLPRSADALPALSLCC